MQTETETQKIEAVDLEQVQGGRGGIVTPLDWWANYWGAVMSFTPPFSTTPLFPTPFH